MGGVRRRVGRGGGEVGREGDGETRGKKLDLLVPKLYTREIGR